MNFKPLALFYNRPIHYNYLLPVDAILESYTACSVTGVRGLQQPWLPGSQLEMQDPVTGTPSSNQEGGH